MAVFQSGGVTLINETGVDWNRITNRANAGLRNIKFNVNGNMAWGSFGGTINMNAYMSGDLGIIDLNVTANNCNCNCNCACNCDCNSGCFAENSRVLLFNGEYELVQNLKVGQKLAGYKKHNRIIDIEIYTVEASYLIEIGDLIVTKAHPFIVKHDNRLTLWIHDLPSFKSLVTEKDKFDFTLFKSSKYESELFTTRQGEVYVKPKPYSGETKKIYRITTNGEGVIWVNDFLAYSGYSKEVAHNYSDISSL
jgi:Hint-domain